MVNSLGVCVNEKMKSHSVNKKPYFICGWYINKKVCTNLIKYFENSSNQRAGTIGVKGKPGINRKEKLSTDVCIDTRNHDEEILSYYQELNKVLEKYKKKFEYCHVNQDRWGMTENLRLQRYKPEEGYFKRHFERTGGLTVNRHLTFMTYLNDIKDGGETEFYYQKLKIKPETGLTLIWGTDWTTTHRGITSKTETKYIATGWYSYRMEKWI